MKVCKNEWKVVKVDETRWKWIKVNESGWIKIKWMKWRKMDDGATSVFYVLLYHKLTACYQFQKSDKPQPWVGLFSNNEGRATRKQKAMYFFFRVRIYTHSWISFCRFFLCFLSGGSGTVDLCGKVGRVRSQLGVDKSKHYFTNKQGINIKTANIVRLSSYQLAACWVTLFSIVHCLSFVKYWPHQTFYLSCDGLNHVYPLPP